MEGILLNLSRSLPKHRKKVIFTLLGGLLAAYFYHRKSKNLARECPETEDGDVNEKPRGSQSRSQFGLCAAIKEAHTDLYTR
jgi:hypothetical protein